MAGHLLARDGRACAGLARASRCSVTRRRARSAAERARRGGGGGASRPRRAGGGRRSPQRGNRGGAGGGGGENEGGGGRRGGRAGGGGRGGGSERGRGRGGWGRPRSGGRVGWVGGGGVGGEAAATRGKRRGRRGRHPSRWGRGVALLRLPWRVRSECARDPDKRSLGPSPRRQACARRSRSTGPRSSTPTHATRLLHDHAQRPDVFNAFNPRARRLRRSADPSFAPW